MKLCSCYLCLIILSILGLLSACGTLKNGQEWGQDVTVSPGWKKVGTSTLDAVASPLVWLPCVTALSLKYRDFDGRISHYASEHNPIFSSQDNTANASNVLLGVAIASYTASFLATPSGNDKQDWLTNKLKGLSVDGVAIGGTCLITSSLKSETHRLRPDGSNYNSMPSGHASGAAVCTRLASLNLESMDISDSTRWIADASLYTVSLGTGGHG
jgi:hypothetical protein